MNTTEFELLHRGALWDLMIAIGKVCAAIPEHEFNTLEPEEQQEYLMAISLSILADFFGDKF
jgi:hypothetical protein